jgi:signal transduction histidine kinase
MTRRDYETQAYLNMVNQELRDKNFQINIQNNEIQSQKENLEQLNSMKDKLLVIVSHDFRSPLQSLKGVLNLLGETSDLTLAEINSIAKALRTQVDYTYNFLENLLLWTKNQMEGANLFFSDLPVKTLVVETVGLLQPTAIEKKLTFCNLVDESHLVVADIETVRLVVRNLISNAIKYSHAGGKITIRSERKADDIIFSVHDNGIGMLPEDQEKIFEKGLRVSKLGTGQEKGTGFGLMLCRDFVAKNGGQFWFSSKPGEGSTFYFSLKASLGELVVS